MKSSEILRDSLAILDGGKAWTKLVQARNKRGLSVPLQEGVCFCAMGAVCRVMQTLSSEERYHTLNFLDQASGELHGISDITIVNDWNSTQFEAVEKIFKRAIELAEIAGE